MRLETLTLSGVLRFPGTVHINFSELPAGLIAIVGANGEGKTSLLEGWPAAVYRKLPSRGDRRLVDVARPDATERTSFEATFIDGDGAVFATTVNLNAKSRSSDAVISRLLEPSENPHWHPLTDGKVKTFDAYIAEHLPPLHVVLASAFAAQNGTGSFVRASPKERKALFSSLLGLDHIADMGTTAAQAAKLIEDELRILDVARLNMRVTRDEMATATDTQRRAKEQLDRLAGEVDDNRGLLETLSKEREKYTVNAAAHIAACERLAELTTTALTFATDLQASDEAIADLKRQAEALPEKAQVALFRDLAAIEARIRNNQGLLDSRHLIEVACAEVDALTREIDSLQTQMGPERSALDIQRGVLNECGVTAAKLGGKEDLLARAQIDVEAISTVPCGGTGPYASCSFLERAHIAQSEIDDLASLPELQRSNARVQERTEQDIASHETLLKQIQRDIEAATVKREQLQKVAEQKVKLDAADDRIRELRADQDAVRARSTEQLDDLKGDINERLGARTRERDEFGARLADMEKTMTEVEVSVTSTKDAHQRLEELTTKTEHATTLARTLEDALRQAQEAHAGAVARVEQLTDNQAQEARLERRAATLSAERVDWDLLGKALGRNGLPTLEMDAAGPAVASYANQLLDASVGSRFTLELKTQQDKKSSAGQKEVFTIQVIDNVDGGTRDVTDLSGGEQILVDEALKNAFLVFSNQRSSTPMRTCWRDETTGSLDAENAVRYADMLRRLQDLAGFDQVIFVTHNAEVSALADARIRVKNGKISTEFPPFESVA